MEMQREGRGVTLQANGKMKRLGGMGVGGGEAQRRSKAVQVTEAL